MREVAQNKAAVAEKVQSQELQVPQFSRRGFLASAIASISLPAIANAMQQDLPTEPRKAEPKLSRTEEYTKLSSAYPNEVYSWVEARIGELKIGSQSLKAANDNLARANHNAKRTKDSASVANAKQQRDEAKTYLDQFHKEKVLPLENKFEATSHRILQLFREMEPQEREAFRSKVDQELRNATSY